MEQVRKGEPEPREKTTFNSQPPASPITGLNHRQREFNRQRRENHQEELIE